MPGFRPKANGGPEDGAQRTTFRPPWVKDGPMPMPMPTTPWVPKRRESQPSQSQPSQSQPPPKEKPILKKQSQVTSPPVQNDEEKAIHVPVQRENTTKDTNINIPKNKEGITTDKKTIEKKVPIKEDKKTVVPPQGPSKNVQQSQEKTNVAAQVPTKNQQNNQEIKEKKIPKKQIRQESVDKGKEDVKRKTVQIQETPEVVTIKSEMQEPPPPPRLPPPPPHPPQMPKIDTKPLTETQKMKLDSLKSRPRRRPDWTDMMKEVEQGVKLKRVKCNDRSAPVLPKAKAKGQFVYESETDNVHNKLLKEIQSGVRLKKVRTNDRSKPILDGLRKFRRQMTLEEQIQKSASVADVVAMAAEPDELDDIDKVRDDLQSTKQMLALELRNKEALERENKRLMARLMNLEVELEKEKAGRRIEKEKGELTNQTRTVDDDKLITKLKEEAAESAKMMKEMEDMYKKTAEELDVTRAKLESAWLQNAQLEMELKNKSSTVAPIARQPSSKKLAGSISNTKIAVLSSEEESEEEESEEESESEEEMNAENAAAHQEKRVVRELKLLTSKHRGMKDKRHSALKEKFALKEQFSKLSKCLREEKRKYKALQKEVDKMAKLVKDIDEEEEEEEEIENADNDESETESESEDEEEDEESEGDLPESTENQEKIANLNRRIKIYETRLTTLKKSNYLLKANIDRRQDELNRQKEMILSLQEDLNAVLAELG